MLVKDPIYQQLHQALNELILKRDFAIGEKFLTEREVSLRFGVSRTTANKALSSLVADGTLEFRKGVGTFVRPGMLGYDLRSLVSFSDKARSAGNTPTTKVIAFRRLRASNAPAHVVSQLASAASGQLFFVERLRLVDGVPAILERRYIVSSLCPQLTRQDLAGSLYAAWTEKHGLVIAGANQTLRAVVLCDDDARSLHADRGSAALAVFALGYINGSKPLWWEETLYRADAYEFHCKLGGLHPALPPTGHLLTKTNSKTHQL